MPDNTSPAGWYRDPVAPADGRYWDGTRWTESVSRAGQTITVPIDAQRAVLPPVPGSELRPSALPATPQPVPTVVVNSPGRSGPSAGGIILALVAIVLVIAVIVFVANGNTSDDEQPPATPAPTEAPPSSEGG